MKKSSKKLTVSTQTLRNLTPRELGGVRGGEVVKTGGQASHAGNCGVATTKS